MPDKPIVALRKTRLEYSLGSDGTMYASLELSNSPDGETYVMIGNTIERITLNLHRWQEVVEFIEDVMRQLSETGEYDPNKPEEERGTGGDSHCEGEQQDA